MSKEKGGTDDSLSADEVKTKSYPEHPSVYGGKGVSLLMEGTEVELLEEGGYKLVKKPE